MLLAMEVKHPLDKRALEADARLAKHVEHAARELGATLEVGDAEAFRKLPMGLELKVVGTLHSLFAKHDVARFIVAVRYIVGHDVR